MYTDNRISSIELQRLSTLIGCKLNNIIHEKFVFSPTCYGLLYLQVNKENYILTNFYEQKEYLGNKDELNSFKFNQYNGDIVSPLEDCELVHEAINQQIINISIVNIELSIINKSNIEDCDTLLDTYGFIFTLEDNYQIAFEKDVLGEQITLHRGYNLHDKYKNIPHDLSNIVEDEYDSICKLEFVDI